MPVELSLLKQLTMKKTISLLVIIPGILFIILALISGMSALSAYLERAEHGAGLMFADAEIFLFITIAFLCLGLMCLWIGKKLKQSGGEFKNKPPTAH